jgi:Flp pilus assembly protein TadG
MRRLAQAFRRCRSGAAALEFALLAPLMILFHLGSVELIQALEAHRRVTHIAAALADLTAQNRAVTSTDLNDILGAGAVLVLPFQQANLGERIASLSANSAGVVSIDWQVSRNWTGGGQPAVPAGYLAAGESVIVSDVAYRHQAMFALVLPVTLTLQKHAYLRPRLSNQVALN